MTFTATPFIVGESGICPMGAESQTEILTLAHSYTALNPEAVVIVKRRDVTIEIVVGYRAPLDRSPRALQTSAPTGGQ
jgi:hypothetical protein